MVLPLMYYNGAVFVVIARSICVHGFFYCLLMGCGMVSFLLVGMCFCARRFLVAVVLHGISIRLSFVKGYRYSGEGGCERGREEEGGMWGDMEWLNRYRDGFSD